MDATAAETIARVMGARPTGAAPLGGGCVGDVRRVPLADGRVVVAKVGAPGSGLALEGFMLGYLAAHSSLPVPAVHHADDRLLVMDWIETSGGITPAVETDAARHLAALHAVRGPAFGFERDTLIGGLGQPNPPTARWLDFFRDHRLVFMAGEAERAGRLSAATRRRVETLAGRLDRWIDEPGPPSLIHGDMWTGNVLCRAGRIAGFVDPAIYHADAEIELAFSTLFSTFGRSFFDAYAELRPIRPGFFEARRDLYNLYPLLVHVRLFGGSYVASVERTLSRFGA